MSRSAWIYQGTAPDVAKAKAHGIDTVYVDPRSSNAKEAIASLRAAGLTPGIYTAASWEPQMTGGGFAQWTSYMLQEFLPRGSAPIAPPYMADLEGVGVDWVKNFLTVYRAHQPARPSAYTNAPFQGGNVPVSALESANMDVYVQLYYGGMTPADPAAALLEIARMGFPADRLRPFYDGARFPSDARDGCIFTLERIP